MEILRRLCYAVSRDRQHTSGQGSPLDRKGVLPIYTPAFLETLRQLEETLQFPAFDLEDAYALGTRLREAGTREP